jgi:hypothetical protein
MKYKEEPAEMFLLRARTRMMSITISRSEASILSYLIFYRFVR